MTAQILNSELSNLIQESKRKHSELRNAAEKSLEELKALRTTSETQIAADLSLRANFVTPFLIACGTKNAKFTGIAVVCLQRLVASRALPRSRLKEVLEAFGEATFSGLDVQLKILQSLPSLLQNYAEDLKGDLLAATLNVCTVLQSSKNGIVNNTAAATLQQLVVAVFDKVVAEDKISLEVPTVAEAPVEDGTIQLRAAAYDAYRVFMDLCLLTEAQKPRFLRVSSLPQTFGLELIESVLTNHAEIFLNHEEQGYILRTRVMPFIVSSMSGRINFATTVRVVRILYTLLRRHLSILSVEAELALGLLTRMLDADTAVWKRALCMEVLRGLFAEAVLVRQIFTAYDANENKSNVLGNIVSTFVRLSAEKPGIIGLGSQSTMPTQSRYTSNSDSGDQAVLEASGIPGIISSSMTIGEANIGISMQWSSMRVPCIDQLDKADPPTIPDTYIYSLSLTCINSFSEGLAKFILPLTIPKKSRQSDIKGDKSTSPKGLERGSSFKKNPVPLNPLSLDDHELAEEVKICADIVESCWPAILATCSTFLNAALDGEYYHGLVRSFQKFAHVAGLLRLTTPRDAFLTSLGKAAVPASIITGSSGSTSLPSPTSEQSNPIFGNAKGLTSVDSLSSNATGVSEKSRQTSTVEVPQKLNTRNMLCLRALLNLGIALGPTLDTAWLIILETLQQADFVIFSSARGAGRSPGGPNSKIEQQSAADNSALLVNFNSEIKAVETAASRLFESTVDFPNDSFLDVVSALCKLFGEETLPVVEPVSELEALSSPTAPRRSSHAHRRIHSVASVSTSQNQEVFFALAKLGDVASINIERLVAFDADVAGWSILADKLIATVASLSMAPSIRIRASEVLVKVVAEAAGITMAVEAHPRGLIQRRLLETFKQALRPLQEPGRELSVSSIATDVDVHKIILEGFRGILEHFGENIVSGWDIAFDIMGSVFVQTQNSIANQPATYRPLSTRSPRLVKSSFASLQLICSDFLSAVPSSCFLTLIDTLYNFSTQDDELNICLTTVTFFWVLSDYISNHDDTFDINPELLKSTNEKSLKDFASDKRPPVSNGALWMILLLRLTAVASDDRLELRNSAIHTLLRVLDANGDHISPEAWSICLQSVIFRVFDTMEMKVKYHEEQEGQGSAADHLAWIETSVVVLSGVSNLLATYLHILTSHESFGMCWQSLLEHFSNLLKCSNLEINTAVFKALKVILSHANTESETPSILDKASKDLVWSLWSQGLPLPDSTTASVKASNQNCLTAYVSSLLEIYRLVQDDIDVKQTQRVLELLRETIQYASAEAYSADVEYLTALQTQVLESLKIIRTDIVGVPSAMITQAAELISLAFLSPADTPPNGKRPTYIALSKAAMSLLESLVLTHSADEDIYTSSAMSSALTALAQPVTLKYTFHITTKSTSPWRLATSTALTILASTLPKIESLTIAANDVRDIWSSIVSISNGIIAAKTPVNLNFSQNIDDQAFDITSFQKLRDLITPALGNPVIPDATRRRYAEALFATSFIHAPQPSDLPADDETIIACLNRPRRGRTKDPVPSTRKDMSYVCLTELFSLVSSSHVVSDVSPESKLDNAVETKSENWTKLAQAAAPFLLLRCGLSLKSYIVDQPLRGLLPQPLSQKRELVFLLERLVGLRIDVNAIPDDMLGAGNYHGTTDRAIGEMRHLVVLYGLLGRAVGVDRARGEEVQGWIKMALGEIGGQLW